MPEDFIDSVASALMELVQSNPALEEAGARVTSLRCDSDGRATVVIDQDEAIGEPETEIGTRIAKTMGTSKVVAEYLSQDDCQGHPGVG